ncbi:hypothetical protein Pmani_011811 [Petrolisthes manimaculis]|uniref:Uncharacterized protein n=1 Tax=Petrolisthes manimaculis TaxID=1843537 RepID=A0AAE1NM93_9EUCA|nr:hypothetical protein Pmani_035227 [Petrolisthes manimaculis]KAK4317082.1 hypothetical protein Pmani_011811 [Petrolisthes manimaculis]
MFVCVLVLAGVATALPTDPQLTSSDNTWDVMFKFLPSLLGNAQQQGGSVYDQMKTVTLDFLPVYRSLVNMKGEDLNNYDLEYHLQQQATAEQHLHNMFASLEAMVRATQQAEKAEAEATA